MVVRYFGYDDKAQVTLDSISMVIRSAALGLQRQCAAYWDFIYGGQLRRYERQCITMARVECYSPVLATIGEHPTMTISLRVGYGGTMGALTNIDREGFGVVLSFVRQRLKWMGYSGDYGPNFFGHAFNTATYIVQSPEFGWLAFGAT